MSDSKANLFVASLITLGACLSYALAGGDGLLLLGIPAAMAGLMEVGGA